MAKITLIVTGALMITLGVVVAAYGRLTHPELTETQLTLELWRYWLAVIALVLTGRGAIWAGMRE